MCSVGDLETAAQILSWVMLKSVSGSLTMTHEETFLLKF